METRSVPEMFGENVFDDRVMRAVLSEIPKSQNK